MSRSPFVSLRHIEEWEWLTCSNDVIKLEFDFDEQNSCWEAVQKGDRVCLRQQNKQLFNDNDEWIIISNGDGSISLKNVISDSYLTQKVISSQGHVIDDTPETWILEVHSLPVLDYGLSDDEVADFILQQCSQIGFFALVNHPLSSHISKLYTAARSSLETSGCQGSKKISLMSPNDFTPPAWWTAPPPQDYYDTCVDVGTRLLNVIFNSLNIKPDPNPIFNLRMMCYSDIGLEEHTDKDWLTILLQDPSLPGLQVEGRDPSNWISVPCTYPVIINIGDAFQSVSGGVLKSKIHRAVPPSDNTRVSFPMFIEPSSWPEVESSSSVITADNSQHTYTTMTVSHKHRIAKTQVCREMKTPDKCAELQSKYSCEWVPKDKFYWSREGLPVAADKPLCAVAEHERRGPPAPPPSTCSVM